MKSTPQQKRITTRSFFASMMIVLSIYTITIGLTLEFKASSSQPIRTLPSKNIISTILILISVIQLFCSLMALVSFLIKGKTFLSLLLIFIGILLIIFCIIASYLFVASIKFDRLDSMTNDGLILMEYENNCCGWKMFRSFGCGAPKETDDTCYKMIGLPYEKVISTSVCLVVVHFLLLIILGIETIKEVNSLKRDSVMLLTEPFVDPDEEE
ncbi:Tetraspanin family protein [Entamoeba marina]